ncbi:MAG: hypothetical protein ACYDG2_23375 [Ruminiclostridium sp.]
MNEFQTDVQENPPVYYCDENNVFKKECETLTFFLYSIAHLQGIFGLYYTLDEIEEIEEDQAIKIRNYYKAKNKYLENWHRVEFYGDYDDCVIALIKNDDWYNVMYSSSDKQHFEEINKFFKTNIFT